MSGPRFSTHTGLPTLIGWVHHTRERGNSPEPRMEDCRLLYTSTNREKVRELLKREEIRYVILGPIERSLYALGGWQGSCQVQRVAGSFPAQSLSHRSSPPESRSTPWDPAYRLQAGAVTASTKETSHFMKDEGAALAPRS